jgi:molybdopterin converting factor small subunit
MSVAVSIPTILRSYTGGARSVEGSGATLDDLVADLESRHAGLRDRIVEDGQLRRFVNVYVNDEDVRFLGGLATPVADGDSVTILPAVAGGAVGLVAR